MVDMAKTKAVTKTVPFSRLTFAQKRVSIAKDVLARLRSKRLEAKHMSWVTIDEALGAAFQGSPEETEVREVFAKVKSCKVCALGACFVSAIDKSNKLSINELTTTPYEGCGFDNEDVLKYLKRWFSEEQLAVIECAFEQGNGYYYSRPGAASWRPKLTDPDKRLRAIMNNIVKNKGTFVL